MYFKNIIGQDKIKKTIHEMCENMYVPHCQLFIDKIGYGGLGLALYYCLQLIYGKKNLERHLLKGSDIKTLLQNPDLKFIYPIYSNKNKVSSDYLKEWLFFIEKNVYGSYGDWLKEIGDENKEGIISVNEIENLQNQINLKSFFGGNKVILIWGLDKMNLSASNKILKLLEEPPKKTFFTASFSKILLARSESIASSFEENSIVPDSRTLDSGMNFSVAGLGVISV